MTRDENPQMKIHNETHRRKLTDENSQTKARDENPYENPRRNPYKTSYSTDENLIQIKTSYK
jgi:hypothetical protein